MATTTQLGTQGFQVSKLGFGCMGLSGAYNDPLPEQDAISVIHYAFTQDITFFDTYDLYGLNGSHEILVGKALNQLPRENIQFPTKFGISRGDGPGFSSVSIDGSPEYVRSSCEASLKCLGVEYIDLYYQHRVDTSMPIEDTVGELKKLVEEGKVKYIGLSEASPDTIRRAHAIHPITAVQVEWYLWTRDIEDEIIPLRRELGIGTVPYSPLGRGFFGVLENVLAVSSLVLYYYRFQTWDSVAWDSVVPTMILFLNKMLFPLFIMHSFKVGELKKLVEEGKVKYIGLSEASPDTIRRAHAVHPITAVQIEWSLWTRDIE